MDEQRRENKKRWPGLNYTKDCVSIESFLRVLMSLK